MRHKAAVTFVILSDSEESFQVAYCFFRTTNGRPYGFQDITTKYYRFRSYKGKKQGYAKHTPYGSAKRSLKLFRFLKNQE